MGLPSMEMLSTTTVICGALFRLFVKSIGLAALLGFLAFAALSAYQEFFVPYRGGGASFWPSDSSLSGPCAAFGAAVGAFAVSVVQRRRGK